MQEIALLPEVIELAGKAALPVVEALDAPVAKELVVRAARPALEELSVRADVPRDLHAAARSALVAARNVLAGDPLGYRAFLRGIHELLLASALPVPCELAEDPSLQ